MSEVESYDSVETVDSGNSETEDYDKNTNLCEETDDTEGDKNLCVEETDGLSHENIAEAESSAEKSGDVSELTDEGKADVQEKTGWSDELVDSLHTKEEVEVYLDAGLKEEKVDGRTCLVRDDIDPDYIDPKTGKSNQALMERGRAPYDAKTGERIELHHIGQEYDSPLAELTETEHGKNTSALHTKEEESWRHNEKQNNHYNNVQRPKHWMERAAQGGQKT